VVFRHHGKIQDYDVTFYSNFHIVVCGLDSIVARRWLNGMLMSLVEYNEDGSVDPMTIVPMVDGGTEGFKGNARVIIPTQTPCIECTLDLYPPQVSLLILLAAQVLILRVNSGLNVYRSIFRCVPLLTRQDSRSIVLNMSAYFFGPKRIRSTHQLMATILTTSTGFTRNR